jgi:hypothetical protein
MRSLWLRYIEDLPHKQANETVAIWSPNADDWLLCMNTGSSHGIVNAEQEAPSIALEIRSGGGNTHCF